MFGPKKPKVSKKDLKKSIVSANDRMRNANTRMEADIKAGKDELKLIEAKHKEVLKTLKDTQDLQGYAKNELEAQQLEVATSELRAKEALSELSKLSDEKDLLIRGNKTLQTKHDSLTRSIASLEEKKCESASINKDLKAIKKERSDGEETLSLLGRELSQLESEVEAYAARKSSTKSEFDALKNKIERDMEQAEGELKDLEEFGDAFKLSKGKEMAELDHAIADRLSELKDMDELMKRKEYDYSTIQSKISFVENRVHDAEERIEYAIKKEQDRVGKIRGDFKDWKIEALDEVARLKIKKKIENIDKAGLKEVLDG